VLVVAFHHLWTSSVEVYFDLIVNKYGGAPTQPGVAKGLFASRQYKACSGDDHPGDPGRPVKRPRMTDKVPYLSKKENGNHQDHPTREVVNA
jgi:hypothetical protein